MPRYPPPRTPLPSHITHPRADSRTIRFTHPSPDHAPPEAPGTRHGPHREADRNDRGGQREAGTGRPGRGRGRGRAGRGTREPPIRDPEAHTQPDARAGRSRRRRRREQTHTGPTRQAAPARSGRRSAPVAKRRERAHRTGNTTRACESPIHTWTRADAARKSACGTSRSRRRQSSPTTPDPSRARTRTLERLARMRVRRRPIPIPARGRLAGRHPAATPTKSYGRWEYRLRLRVKSVGCRLWPASAALRACTRG